MNLPDLASERHRVTDRASAMLLVLLGVAAGISSSLGEPYSIIAVGILAFSAVLAAGVRFLSATVLLLLVSKPLVDLTWRWSAGEVAGQEVNLQAGLGVCVIALGICAVASRSSQVRMSTLGLGLLASASISVFLSPSAVAVNELLRLYAGVAFLFIGGSLLSREANFERFGTLFLVVVCVPLVLSVAQLRGMLPFEYWDWADGAAIGRVSGTYRHPLNLATFLLYAIPVALYFLDKGSGTLTSRLCAAGFLGFAGFILVFTYHRTALLAIGLEITLWLVLQRQYGRVLLALVAGLLLIPVLAAPFLNLYDGLLGILRGEVAFGSDMFLRGRGPKWYLFLESFADAHPLYWLMGRGGSVAEGYVPYVGYVYSNEPHNDVIRILHAYGLLGLTLYGFLFVGAFRASVQLRGSREAFSRQLGTVTLVTLSALSVLSLTTEPTRFPSAIWYLCALVAAVEAKRERERRDSQRVTESLA